MKLGILIDKKLSRYLPRKNSSPGKLAEAMRYSVFSGGKRIRPVITIEAYKVCGKRDHACLPEACAIELVHTYSLIHDDLPGMDDDDYRRGKKSCHKVFGEANAILAGDALLTLAFNVLSKGSKKGKTALKTIEELSDAIGYAGMAGGQALDLDNSRAANTDLINKLKTAKLFEVSAKIGGITAGAGAKEIKALAKFGLLFGVAFQAADDIADGECNKGNKARQKIEKLIREAKSALNIFGNKACRLKEIADQVVEKIS